MREHYYKSIVLIILLLGDFRQSKGLSFLFNHFDFLKKCVSNYELTVFNVQLTVIPEKRKKNKIKF